MVRWLVGTPLTYKILILCCFEYDFRTSTLTCFVPQTSRHSYFICSNITHVLNISGEMDAHWNEVSASLSFGVHRDHCKPDCRISQHDIDQHTSSFFIYPSPWYVPLMYVSQNFKYLFMDLRDKANSNLLSCIPTSNMFIEAGIKSGGIFVHWCVSCLFV